MRKTNPNVIQRKHPFPALVDQLRNEDMSKEYQTNNKGRIRQTRTMLIEY